MSADPQYVAHAADIAPVAALLADATRAAILTTLLDGRPLAAGELACVAGVGAATASAHLARLLDGGLVTFTKQGRHRYYRLAGPEIAAAIEALAHISPRPPVRSLRQSRQAAALQDARTCYDHLAGRAGVALLAALLEKKILNGAGGGTPSSAGSPALIGEAALTGAAPSGPAAFTGKASPFGAAALTGAASISGEASRSGASAPAYPALPREFVVTAAGAVVLAAFGVDVEAARRSRRHFARACLDWTQRRPHLSGALGAAVTARLLELRWFERGSIHRALRLTETGRDGLAAAFGCVIAG